MCGRENHRQRKPFLKEEKNIYKERSREEEEKNLRQYAPWVYVNVLVEWGTTRSVDANEDWASTSIDVPEPHHKYTGNVEKKDTHICLVKIRCMRAAVESPIILHMER